MEPTRQLNRLWGKNRSQSPLTSLSSRDRIDTAAWFGLEVRSGAASYQRDLGNEESSMYAVICTGGKQYRVSEGDTVFIEKLNADVDSTVEFDQVLVVGKEDGMVVGAPTVDGAVVTGKVLKNGKAKKVTIWTYRPKKGSARKMGHRQPYTKVEIQSIKA